MSDEVKKDEVQQEEVKLEAVYPDYPYNPTGSYCPPDMGPNPGPAPDHHMRNTLAERLRCLMGQQATIYTDELVATGIVHAVGEDYLELHVLVNNTQRVAYFPLNNILAVVPGGPLGAGVPQVSTPGIL